MAEPVNLHGVIHALHTLHTLNADPAGTTPPPSASDGRNIVLPEAADPVNDAERRRRTCAVTRHDPIPWRSLARWLCRRCGLSWLATEFPPFDRRRGGPLA